jgi:hypothetical protein
VWFHPPWIEVGLTVENASVPRAGEADAPAQSGPAANIS